MNTKALEIVYRAPDELLPNPDNWRTHPDKQKEALAGSIAEFGWVDPVLFNTRTSTLIDGHARVEQAIAFGTAQVPVIELDLSEADAKRLLLSLDRITEMAGHDADKLSELLHEFSDSLPPGWDTDALEAIQAEMAAKLDSLEVNRPVNSEEDPKEGGDDFAGEVTTRSRAGQVWQLGPHRLYVGSCTEEEGVTRLFAGKSADMLLTDPPYGVDMGGKSAFLNALDGGSRIEDDIVDDDTDDDALMVLFTGALTLAPLREYNTTYIFMSGLKLHLLRICFEHAGYTSANPPYLVWVKNHHSLSRSDYNPRHELVLYGWKGKHRFYGAKSRDTVLEYDKPTANKLHPTMKPLDLLGQLVEDGCHEGGLVYDPFLGSGSTLIAAHRSGRVCYGCEIEPKYADVILARYEAETGSEATLCE